MFRRKPRGCRPDVGGAIRCQGESIPVDGALVADCWRSARRSQDVRLGIACETTVRRYLASGGFLLSMGGGGAWSAARSVARVQRPLAEQRRSPLRRQPVLRHIGSGTERSGLPSIGPSAASSTVPSPQLDPGGARLRSTDGEDVEVSGGPCILDRSGRGGRAKTEVCVRERQGTSRLPWHGRKRGQEARRSAACD